MINKKVLLCILDGWGVGGNDPHINAVLAANPVYYNNLLSNNPHARLTTHGTQVGLPEGQMGNSEVGHLNIGAGRIVYQELQRINHEIETRRFYSNKTLIDAMQYAKDNKRKLHFIGLVSDGGVHSHIQHLKALCDMAHQIGLENEKVMIHAITDGRDCDPKSGKKHILDLQKHLASSSGTIATICGRYYAMDRDKRWDRVKLAYDLYVNGVGEKINSIELCFDQKYAENETDEFIKPVILTDKDFVIEENDVVICFNFRTDRCREITEVLTQKSIHEYNLHPLKLYYVTMTQYDETFQNIKIVFGKENLKNTLGEVLSKHNKTQCRAAETEKYPHVTFFFSGGREDVFVGEQRILIPSPKVATYDIQPEMSAQLLTDSVLNCIENKTPDFLVVNFANPDMVGHTGVFEAVVTAIKTIDACLSKLIPIAQTHNYDILLIADHGNAEKMKNEDGSPHTSHTTNLVNIILLTDKNFNLTDGKLADIAPTILQLLDLEKPNEMDGQSLLIPNPNLIS